MVLGRALGLENPKPEAYLWPLSLNTFGNKAEPLWVAARFPSRPMGTAFLAVAVLACPYAKM